jgi:O-Antigen ligase
MSDIRIRISATARIEYLFAFFWLYMLTIRRVTAFLTQSLGLYQYVEYLNAILIFIVISLCATSIIKVLKFRDGIFYLLITLIVGIHYIIYPKTNEWISTNGLDFLFYILPFYFLGIAIGTVKVNLSMLKTCSIINLICSIVVMFVTKVNSVEIEQSMGIAYLVLPNVLLLIYFAVKNTNFSNFFFALIGFIFITLQATRFPIFLCVVFTIVVIILYTGTIKKVILSILGITLACLIYLTYESILLYLYNILNKYGFSVRIIEQLLEGNITDDNGRDYLVIAVKNMIADHPFVGNGLYSDRIESLNFWWVGESGIYVHNIFYELWSHFGYIYGTIILLIILYLVFKGLLSCTDNSQRVLMLVFSFVCLKLIVSSSYLETRELYILLGICISNIRLTNCIKPTNIKERV